MGPLAWRVVTAMILAPLVIAGDLWLPRIGFELALAALLLLGALEWAALAGLDSRWERLGLVLGIAMLQGLVGWALASGLDPWLLVAPAVLWWLGITGVILTITTVSPAAGRSLDTALAGVLVLTWGWVALIWLRDLDQGPWLVLFLLTLVWVADSGAYFAGRRWGRSKLAPQVSPGKTWAGVYGALAGALLWGGLLARAYPDLSLAQQLGVLGLAVLTVVISIVGDLYESLLKRRRGLKDSGALLPGHGGMLDRIDSLLAATPVFALGWWWLVG